MIRLFVPDPLAEGAMVTLSADQAHYLQNVMRQGAGDAILVFNGLDGEWRAVLADVSRRACRLRIEARTRDQAVTPDVELAIALVKRARLEIIVEKAVELGVRRVRLVTTRRTNADRVNLARLQAIAREAAEQTGRLDCPQVGGPELLARLLETWEAGRGLMFCDEAGDDPEAPWGGGRGRAAPALDALATLTPATPFTVLIGPEGGFDPQERAQLRALPFVTPVALGPRILRADTAAIAALTLWQAALGDWRTAAPTDGC